MNAIGLRTLLSKEVRRFMRVPGQTLLSPLISTSLYFLVFGYSLAGRLVSVEGVPYLHYIVPGLVFLGIANNSFLNSSSSFFIGKIQGTVVDLLVAPLGPFELMCGFVLGAMVRGMAVGVLTWGVATLFTGFQLAHPIATLGLLLGSAYVFAQLGLWAAMWSEKFEQINFFPTFLMLPLTFLGGVFYSVRDLPPVWQTISLFNPMVYMVDALRFGILDASAFSPWIGAAMLAGLSVITTGVTYSLLARGYKLRS